LVETLQSCVRFPMRSLHLSNLANPSSRTMVLRSTQPLKEMSTRILQGGKRRPARKADNLTAIDCLEYLSSSTSQNSMGLHGLSQGFYLLLRNKLVNLTGLY
jgi:hypothetical protein